jgi:two-component system invasion response regulator UvrY
MKIFIADRSEIFRMGLSKLLKRLYNHVTISESGSIKVLQEQTDWKQTDLVILQQSSDSTQARTDFTGMECLSENGLKILVLSDYTDLSQARNLFHKGVKGYADRASSTDIISDAVTKVLSGKLYVEPSLLFQYFDNHPITSNELFKTHLPSALTDKELEIVTYLIKGFKTSEISKLLSKKATT